MTVYQNDPTRNGPSATTVFYFSSYNPVIGLANSALNVFHGTPMELREVCGGRAPGLTFAVFNNETTPPTLIYRATGVSFSFKDARNCHDDFPQFYIGLCGDLLDSDSFSSAPVMYGPAKTLKPVKHP